VIPWLLAAHSKPAHYWPRDICVSAPTGSGKTLSFVIPVVQVIAEAACDSSCCSLVLETAMKFSTLSSFSVVC
jgi:superfamily II DNA/RNA helicase